MSQSDSSSTNTLLIGLAAAALVAAGAFYFLSSDDSADKSQAMTPVEKLRRPINQRKGLTPQKLVKATPIKLPARLQKRVGATRVATPLQPANKAAGEAATAAVPTKAKANATDDDGEQEKLPADKRGLEGQKATGSLSKESIMAGIKAIKPQIKACFDQGLKHNPSLAGRVLIDFEIEANDDGKGKVVRGEVKDSEVQSPFFEACVLKEIGGQVFEAPEGGGSVRVTYPFNFDPGGGFGGTEAQRNGTEGGEQ